ncbi:prepilin peptidase [Seohaeicola saemankumensis]|uniref:Prepilin peptidase n=1 Tax=Seohaeicola saemankumensis TaxID=481181 RepID=A0ABW3TH44_9RHOB
MAVAYQIMIWFCFGFLLYLAWQDFLTFRIRNRDVLIFSGMVLALLALRGFEGALPDVMAGLLLFGLGFVMWLLGAMGAGDVKLYLPLGVFVGWSMLPIYVVFLLLGSVLLLMSILAARRFPSEKGLLRARLTKIARTKGVPYAVPMAFGAILTMLPHAIQM